EKPLLAEGLVDSPSLRRRSPAGGREEALIPQARQLLVADQPLAGLAPTARPLLGANAPLAAPLADRVLGLAQALRHILGRIPVLHGALPEQLVQDRLDPLQPLLDAHVRPQLCGHGCPSALSPPVVRPDATPEAGSACLLGSQATPVVQGHPQ